MARRLSFNRSRALDRQLGAIGAQVAAEIRREIEDLPADHFLHLFIGDRLAVHDDARLREQRGEQRNQRQIGFRQHIEAQRNGASRARHVVEKRRHERDAASQFRFLVFQLVVESERRRIEKLLSGRAVCNVVELFGLGVVIGFITANGGLVVLRVVFGFEEADLGLNALPTSCCWRFSSATLGRAAMP